MLRTVIQFRSRLVDSTSSVHRKWIHMSRSLLVEKQVKEIQIPVPWGHIAGKWWGSMDVQPMLGLHGWQDNAGTWDRFAPLLPPDVSLLSVDLPGHGLSSPFPMGQPYHQFDYLMSIRRIVQHYGWGKVSLLGHSMGSILSFMYSAVFPDEVDKYIGVDALKPYSHKPDLAAKRWGKAVDNMLSIIGRNPNKIPAYPYDEARDRWIKATKDSMTQESCEVMLLRGAVEVAEGRYSYTRDARIKEIFVGSWTHEFVLDFAANIECNVLNIKAVPGIIYEKSLYHEDVVKLLQKSLGKRFEYHTVEGMHHIHMNNPEVIAPIINNFLKS